MAEFDPDAYLNKEDKKKKSGFDPDAYLKKTQPESALQTFGRSSASLADSALNALTGTLDYGAYALARAAGRSPEQATAETTSPKDVFGRAFGVTGTQGYEQAPLRQLGTAIGEGLQGSVIQPVAQTTGLPEADVGNMLNSLMMGAGPAVPKVAGAVKPVVKGVVAAPRAVADIAGGAYGAATGKTAAPGARPQPWQQPSVRQPVGETYIPADVLEQMRSGMITPEEASSYARPTSELSGLSATGGTVPFAGQGMRAFGEQLGETYRNPMNLLTDLGADVLTGTPLPTIGRIGYKGVQAYNANKLSNLGFTPLSAAEEAAFRGVSGAVKPSDIPQPIREAAAARVTPVQPLQLGYEPQRMYVSPEGVASTDMIAANRAGIEQKYPPVTVGPAVPETIAPTPTTPAPRTAPATESVLGQKLTPEQILAQIQARSGKKGAGIFETAGEAPPPPIDLTANRASFLDKINQHRAGLEETRAQNRETFSGTAENLGRGTEAERLARMTPAERADYFMRQATKSEGMTDAAVVKDMVSTTTNTGIRRNNKTNIVDNSVFDELAADAGVLLDWSTAPDISKMGFKEGKNAISDWMYKQIKTDANDLGLDTRTGGMRGQIRQMEEANKNIQGINPAEEAAALNAAQERMKKLRGGSSMEMKSTPQLEDITGAAQDVAQGKLAGSGDSFNTTYSHNGNIVTETKNPGYHNVEIDHPNGSKTVFKVHQFGPTTEYIKTTFDPVGRSNVERSTTPFPDFVSVENVMRNPEQFKSGFGPVAPDDMMEMRVKTPSTIKFGENELPVSNRISDWKQDRLFKTIAGEESTAYRSGRNVVVDTTNPFYKETTAPFGQMPSTKVATDIETGVRKPFEGSKFNPELDAPFNMNDMVSKKIPTDSKFTHIIYDRNVEMPYAIENNPNGLKQARAIHPGDRVTQRIKPYNIDYSEMSSAMRDVVDSRESAWMQDAAAIGKTADGRGFAQFEVKLDNGMLIKRAMTKDIQTKQPFWFEEHFFDDLQTEIYYVPTNTKMKIQKFTPDELYKLPTNEHYEPIFKDIPLPSQRKLNQIFTTKKKGK